MLATMAMMMLQAAGTGAAPPVKTNPAYDPNRVICVTDATTGSRLGRTRKCLRASEWESLHNEERDQIEKIQAARATGHSG